MSGTKRPAEIVLGAESRKLRRDLRQAEGEVREFGRKAAGSLRSTLGTAFSGALGLASLGGIVSVAQDVLADEKALTRLGIQAEVTDGAVRDLAAAIAVASDATGRGTSEIISGAGRIVTLTGDFKLAQGAAAGLARASTATGSSLEDLAGVAAAVSQNLKVEPGQIEKALDILVVQGKKGAIELKDLAVLLPTLTASFGALNTQLNRGPEALAKLGAAAQIVQRATGTPAEAATALNALFKALSKNAERFEQAQIEIFEVDPRSGEKRVRDFVQVVDDLANSDLAKDPAALQKALGTAEAFKAFTALKENFGDFTTLIGQGLDGGGVIARDFERYLESPAGRIERAWTRAQNSLANAVTPERIETIADAAESLAAALGFAVDNASTLMTVFAAVKVAQIGAALSRWGAAAQAMQTATGAATGHMGALGRTAGALPAKFAAAAGKAGLIAGTLVSAFQAGVALREALGFEDDRLKTPFQRQDDVIEELQTRRDRLREDVERDSEGLSGTGVDTLSRRQAQARLQHNAAELARVQADLDRERSVERAMRGQVDLKRLMKTAPDAADDVLTDLHRRIAASEAMARLGSGLGGEVQASEVTRRFAPQIADIQDSDALRFIAELLSRQLEEQKRHRELQERVASTRYQGGPRPGQISAPRSSTRPQ